MLIHFSEAINTTLMNVHGARSLAWHKHWKQGGTGAIKVHKIRHMFVFSHSQTEMLKTLTMLMTDWSLTFTVTCA